MPEDTSPGAGDDGTTTPTPAVANAETPPVAAQGDEPEAPEDGSQPAEEEKAKAEASDAARKLNERKKSANERISELTQKWRGAERDRDRLLNRVQELEGKVARPDPAKYDDPQKYQADDAAAVAAQYRHEDAKAEAEAANQQADDLRKEAWSERCEDFAANVPDFQETITNRDLIITPLMASAMQEMDDGPQLAYHLGKNPSEAKRISRLAPAQAIYEMGRMSARLSSPPPKRVTQAPEPVKTVSGSAGGPTKDPGKMSMDEFAAWRKAGGGR